MELMGTWPFSINNKTRYLKICLFILFYIATLFGIWGCLNQVFHYVDMIVFAESVIVSGSGMLPFIKNTIFLARKEKLREIITAINDLYVNIPIELSETVNKHAEESKRKCNKFTKTFVYILAVSWILFNISPVINYLQSKVLVLPEPSKYPFNYEPWGIYLFIYFLQSLHGLAIVVTAIGDALFLDFNSFVCTRIEALQEFFEVSVKEATNLEKSTKLFEESINYHRKIYK